MIIDGHKLISVTDVNKHLDSNFGDDLDDAGRAVSILHSIFNRFVPNRPRTRASASPAYTPGLTSQTYNRGLITADEGVRVPGMRSQNAFTAIYDAKPQCCNFIRHKNTNVWCGWYDI